MREQIDNLVRLQAIELDRARLDHAIRALPTEIGRAEAAFQAARKQSATAAEALAREEALRQKQEKELAVHRQKSERFRAQLESVKTPAQAEAIEHEMKFAAAEIGRLEDEEFASLERSETGEAELARAREQAALLAASLDTVRAGVASRKEEYSAELAALDQRRDELRPHIEVDLLARFDHLAVSRGTAVVRAENQQCTACRMGIRPQAWNQLREGELVPCDSCSRLLYWDDAMQPAPKAPQPEPIPGQGRAVRRAGKLGS